AEVIKQKPTVRWLFLTLTVRNVYDGTELNKSLSDMSKGFNRMMKYKKINKNLVGFMRATEVTVNNIDNSYNQHMHVLVCEIGRASCRERVKYSGVDGGAKERE